MIKYAVSNIALPAYRHQPELGALADLNLQGLEVAPSRVWTDTWKGLSASQVRSYRKMVNDVGLQVVGLHSLFYDHPELGLFREPEIRTETLDFLVHLSKVCRDLGGRTLIYGGGRSRNQWAEQRAYDEAIEFAGELCHRIQEHGTCFCFEPLGPYETDFIHSAYDSMKIVEAVNHPALQVQLDAKALKANGEATLSTFQGVRERLVHYHANEPGLGPLGSTNEIDHERLGECLRIVNYSGYVSIEQRMMDESNPIADIVNSVNKLGMYY